MDDELGARIDVLSRRLDAVEREVRTGARRQGELGAEVDVLRRAVARETVERERESAAREREPAAGAQGPAAREPVSARDPASDRDPRPPAPSAAPSLDFAALARDAEERMSRIEERVSSAARTVQRLSAPTGRRGEAGGSPGSPGGRHGEAGSHPGEAGGQSRSPGDDRPPPSAPRPEPKRGGGSRLDVNEVGFDDLRQLGLTVAQAARLLASRDVRRGFTSLDELEDLRDLPRRLLNRLRRRLYVREPPASP